MDKIQFVISLTVIFGAISLVFNSAYKQGYKAGQIDERKGIVKNPYKLIEFKDGKREYLRESQINYYTKSYREGYKIIE